MKTNNAAMISAIAVAAVIAALAVGPAFAYTSSVLLSDNSLGADWLSIDVYTGDDPAAPSATNPTSLSFRVDPETVIYNVDSVEYTPAAKYSIRTAGSQAYSTDLMGSFSVNSANPAYGALIKSVTFVFVTDGNCVLAGGHPAQGEGPITPTVMNSVLADDGTGVYVHNYVLQKIIVHLIGDVYVSGGNAYVNVGGGSGSSIPINDLVNPNHLQYMFSVKEHTA